VLSAAAAPVRPGQEPPARMGSPTCRLHTGRPWLWPPSSSLPRTTVHCVSLANTPVKRVSHHVLPELSGGSHEAGLHHAYPSRPPERATEHSFTGLAAFPGKRTPSSIAAAYGGVATMGIAWRSSADPQDGSGPASTGDCRTFSCTDGTARRMDSTRRAGLIGQPGPRTGPRRMPRDGP